MSAACRTSRSSAPAWFAERKQILDVVVRLTSGRIPVIAATGSQSHSKTVELSEHAEKAGADALLIVTPYYIRPPQRGLVAYYNDLGRRTSQPILMYHIPGRASVGVTIQTLEEIAAATPHFVGRKHASPDLTLVTEALSRFGADFRIFVGLEELSFPMLALGACGMINAVSNIAPRLIASLYEAVSVGRSGRRPPPALPAVRSQPRSVLRYESDPAQVHGKAARVAAGEPSPLASKT